MTTTVVSDSDVLVFRVSSAGEDDMNRSLPQTLSCFRYPPECIAALMAVALAAACSVGGAATPVPPPQAAHAPSNVSTVNLERNKHLAEGFFQQVLGKQDLDAAPRYLREDYIQHNPNVPQGLKGFQDYFRAQFAKMTPEAKQALKVEILHSVAEGDFVVVHVRITGVSSKGEPFDRTEFDLFRVEGDKLAEHWDAIP